ncbi:MAG: hypothetical protein HN509_04750 [Halobacteriovoraceae bacterium]|jgi:hypothetical protein|nr:hypothetical protein [Halobacteriovoraceae bacterium]
MSKLRFSLTFLSLFLGFFCIFYFGDYFLNSHVYFRIFDFNTHHCVSSINCIPSFLFSQTQEGHMLSFFILSRILRFFDLSHGLMITQILHSFFVAFFMLTFSYLLRFKHVSPWWLFLPLLLFPELNQMIFTAEDNIVFYGFLIVFLSLLYFPNIIEDEERIKDKHVVTGMMLSIAMFFHSSTLIFLPLMGIAFYDFFIKKKKEIKIIFLWPIICLLSYFLIHCLFTVNWSLEGITKAPVINVILGFLGFGKMTIGTAAFAKHTGANLSYLSQVQGAIGGMLLPDSAYTFWKFITIFNTAFFTGYCTWIFSKKYRNFSFFRTDYWLASLIISIAVALTYEPAEAERWDYFAINMIIGIVYFLSLKKDRLDKIILYSFISIQVLNSILTYSELQTLYSKETANVLKARSEIREIPKGLYRKYLFPIESASVGAYIASHFPKEEKNIFYLDVKTKKIYQNPSAFLSNKENRWDEIFKSDYCVFCFFKKDPQKGIVEVSKYFEVLSEKNIFIHPEVEKAINQTPSP